MLLGGMKRKQFGLPGIPPYGAPQTSPEMPDMTQQQDFAQPGINPVKPSFFQQGGLGRKIAGTIGDGIAQWAGGEPVYAMGQMQRQEAQQRAEMMRQKQAMDQAAADQKRAADWEDWQKKYQYEVTNPKPATNDTVADYNFWKGVLPEDQFKTYIQNKVNPPRWVQLPNGQWGMVGGDAGGATPKAYGSELPQGFVVEGGQTGAQSGTFPR